MPKNTKDNLSENLKKLEKISDWFENQEDIDLEKGLEKVREGVELIKESKKKLKNIENQFEELKREAEEI